MRWGRGCCPGPDLEWDNVVHPPGTNGAPVWPMFVINNSMSSGMNDRNQIMMLVARALLQDQTCKMFVNFTNMVIEHGAGRSARLDHANQGAFCVCPIYLHSSRILLNLSSINLTNIYF